MPIQAEVKDGTTQIVIKDEMTIYTALEQKTDFSEYLKQKQDMQVNLAGVSEIDSAGLQILLFLKQESINSNFKLTLIEHSQSVADAFKLLDLSAHFGDPIVISADWKKS